MTRRSVRDGWAALPPVALVLAVAGGGMAAVVATSWGLLPLYGQPDLSTAGWTQVAPELALAVRESLLVAVPAALLAVAVGLGLATLLLSPGGSARWVRLGCAVVLAVPHLVGATSVGLLLGDGGVAERVLSPGAGGWPALVAGPWPVATVLTLAWKESAFVALVVAAALGPGHRERMEVARGLGAGARQRWTRVLLPTALPAAGGAGLVVLVYSVGSYEVAWLLGRSYPETLPVLAARLFGSIDLLDRPAAAAAAATASALAVALAAVCLVLLPRATSAVRAATGHDLAATPRGRR